MSGGRVLFVGCGPGAADLLTLRAVDAIGRADVVIWSATQIDRQVLAERMRPGAEVVAWPPATQREILAVYERAAVEELLVVRLKGGDPTLFGNLEPELSAAHERGLACQIVPGVSAVSAAAAALGREVATTAQPLLLVGASGGADAGPAAGAAIALHGAGVAPRALHPGHESCAPEYVIPARNLSYPLANPSTEFQGTGAAFLFNGATGTPLDIPGGGGNAIISPEPQRLSQFGGSFNGGRPVGDLGATTAPDILLPAALQNSALTDDGKIWVFNGTGGGGGATGSWQFASMTDPTPQPGGNFGGAFSGVGDVVTGPDSPANELLVGGFRFDPFTEGTRFVEDVHFVNVQTAKNLMTIPNPTGRFEEGFGVGLVPMGDLNGDGFLDFAASSYLANVRIGGDGQAWIFRSDNSPLPQPPATAPPVAQGPAATPPAPTTQEVALRPGRCANQTLGTTGVDSLRGTIAGDQIFGFAGNDRIRGFDGQDCLSGGSGRDRLEGGNDADKILGGSGNDRLDGGNDRDRLYGGTGRDRLAGNGGNDMLAGGPSNDRLFGGIGNDQIFGEAGTDRIVGGPGVNRIDGGSGNDSIDARNGRRDRVICGTGRDRVRADRVDRLNGCERVTFGGRIR